MGTRRVRSRSQAILDRLGTRLFGGPDASTCTEQITLERRVELVSVPEMARRLGVSRSTLGRLVRDGVLPGYRPGTDHYYIPADVALPARTCQQCGTSLADRPPNARFCLACYQARRKAAAAAHYQRRKADRAASARG